VADDSSITVGANQFVVNYNDAGGTAVTITTVPEPQTWGMLLAGLGVLGQWQRSRRKAA